MRLRSLLFAPGNRRDLVRKFPRWKADGNVIDLEDGTPDAEKSAARESLRELAEGVRAAGLQQALFVRVNGPASPHHLDDLCAVAAIGGVDGVVLPKVERVEQVMQAAAVLAARPSALRQAPLRLILGLETAWGVERAADLAQVAAPILAVYFGAEDFIADLGGIRTPEGLEVLYARSRVALAARLAGVIAVDQVVVAVREADQFRADARIGRRLGYQGKLCVHPAQVEWAHAVFTPDPVEVDRSRRLIAAYEAAVAAGRGTIEFEGQMIDGPLLKHAQHVLDAAREDAP